jgi:hypothetical protein
MPRANRLILPTYCTPNRPPVFLRRRFDCCDTFAGSFGATARDACPSGGRRCTSPTGSSTPASAGGRGRGGRGGGLPEEGGGHHAGEAGRDGGLVSAFIFAVQMLSFRCDRDGGHLSSEACSRRCSSARGSRALRERGAVRQALVFADGGLSALGLNVINMALVTALGGYLVFRGLRAAPTHERGRRARVGIAGSSRWCWRRWRSRSSTRSAAQGRFRSPRSSVRWSAVPR